MDNNAVSTKSRVDQSAGSLSRENCGLEHLAAEWQKNELNKKMVREDMMKQEVLQRLDRITESINADCRKTTVGSDHAPVSRLNWDELYETSANVMDLYTKEVDDCLAELDKFYRKQYLWQEAAFTIDSHRGAARIGVSESWVVNKETHLEYMRQELSSSARVIKKTLEELSRK
ncbi:LANO_0G13300g1_1 [Lachancea nothofagi CBS 11611]|uniref:LANO_0G13300g1_1 n=1 Tax=Lachancea nothofagi CBS 11611 TaxID=1266666 RepID=A0A1G4KJZ9_9SACH|nr:LANO_0G13300g1_1 [Lachancea nothofagi CBS 11611]